MSMRRASFDAKVRLAGGRPYADFLRASRQAEASDTATLVRRSALAAARMARYAAEKTDWYARAYAAAGIDVRGLEDDPTGFSRLPIVSKADVRDHFQGFVARDSGARKTVEATTGGSTGVPLRVLKDVTVGPAAQSWRMLGWWGVHPSDDSAQLVRGPAQGLRLRLHDALWWPTRRVHLDVGAVDAAGMQRFVEDCRRVRPRLLVGYAGALHELARAVQEHGWEFPPPRAISSTAAPLTPVQRRDVTEALGAPVYDTYRAGEVSYIGGQCEQLGGLHVLADQKLLEVVDAEGRPVPPGVEGDVVVTDLLNRAFPLVRYRLGDVAAYSPEPCPCGRPFPLLTRVVGRSNDVIRTPSGKVSAYSFASVLMQHPGVRQYQIHQLHDHSLTLKIVPAAEDLRVEDFDQLSRSVSLELGDELPVRVALVPSIAHERGKQKSVVSDLP
jgi:phenylacetate-CoA ligase